MAVLARGGRGRAVAATVVLATLALVVAGAPNAEAAKVKLKGDSSSLIFDQDIFSSLDPLGVGILPTPPAEATSGGERFPISGGDINPVSLTGTIKHDGGLVFVGDNARVRVKGVSANFNRNSDVTAKVDGRKMSFLSLDFSRSVRKDQGRRIKLRKVDTFLTQEAADALNEAFGTDFQVGTRFGELRVDMKLAGS